MKQPGLIRAVSIFAIIISAVAILVYAKPFLVPLTFGAVLSMLLLPFTKWLEAKGVNSVVAIIVAILMLILFFIVVIALLTWQVSGITDDFSTLQNEITNKYHQLRNYVAEHLGILKERQQQMMKQQQPSASGIGTGLIGALSGLGSLLANLVLVLVYIFLFIFFRSRLKNFVIKLVSQNQRKNVIDTINKAQKVSQKYLTGLFMMIVCLWVMYSIGFSIVGVKNPFFFAILCGLLEIVPFVGNLTGTAITVLMALAQGQGANVVIGIVVTYAIVQFVQTYILEPLVVGAEVNINPLFTVVGLVAGEMLWGIAGMVLAIPLMGIFKIVCDHVEALHPYGYLIGQDRKNRGTLSKKLTGVFKRSNNN
jgi:predicted PurR-regulated permease PerM